MKSTRISLCVEHFFILSSNNMKAENFIIFFTLLSVTIEAVPCLFFFLRLPLNAFLNLGRSVGVKTNKQERKSEATLKKNQFQGKKRVMLTQFPPTRTESLSYERVSLLFLG